LKLKRNPDIQGITINDDEVGFVQDQHAQLDFYIASSLKQQSVDRHIATIGHIILIPS
jgi:predicted alpha/beta hydrolase